jgi:hypothetical protein
MIVLKNDGGEPAVEIRVEEPTVVPRPVRGKRWRRVVGSRRVWLTVVVGLLGVWGLSYVPGKIEGWKKDRCRQQLKQLGGALLAFQEVHGHYPAAAITDEGGKPLLSWRVAVLPHLGYSSLYEQFHLTEPWDSPHNLALVSKMPEVYVCPRLADRREFVTGYQAVVGPKPKPAEPGAIAEPGALFEWSRGVEMREVLDGASMTVMLAETNRAVVWTQPEELRFNPTGPLPPIGSGHSAGFHIVLADGSARFLGSRFEPDILRGLLTRDGNEVLDAG